MEQYNNNSIKILLNCYHNSDSVTLHRFLSISLYYFHSYPVALNFWDKAEPYTSNAIINLSGCLSIFLIPYIEELEALGQNLFVVYMPYVLATLFNCSSAFEVGHCQHASPPSLYQL